MIFYKTYRFKILKTIGSLAVLLLSFSFSACNQKEEAETKEPVEEAHQHEEGHEAEHSESRVEFSARQYEVAGIELGKPELKNLSKVLKISGLLDVPPQNLVSISAPLGG